MINDRDTFLFYAGYVLCPVRGLSFQRVFFWQERFIVSYCFSVCPVIQCFFQGFYQCRINLQNRKVLVGRIDHVPRCEGCVGLFNEVINNREREIVRIMQILECRSHKPRAQWIFFPFFETVFLLYFVNMQKELDDDRPVIGQLLFEVIDRDDPSL